MKTKLDIYCGILGAGKTTLIKQMLECAYREYKTAIIENEIGPVNLDAEELKGSSVEISKVTSGCICCTVKGSFSAAIRRLCKSAQPDYIVIEPSGAADIRSILELCTSLPEIEIGRVIMVANGRKILSLLKAAGPFLTDQITCVRHIYISRAESLSDEQIHNISSVLKGINPKAEIVSVPLKELGADSFPGIFILPAAQSDLKEPGSGSNVNGSASISAYSGSLTSTVSSKAAGSVSLTQDTYSKISAAASLEPGVNPAAPAGAAGTMAAFKIKPAKNTAPLVGLKSAEGVTSGSFFTIKPKENAAASLYSQVFSYLTPKGLPEAYLEQLSGLSRSENWEGVARVKGYISTAQGRFLKVDYVFGDWSFSERENISEENANRLIFIGKEMPEEKISTQLENFFAGARTKAAACGE